MDPHGQDAVKTGQPLQELEHLRVLYARGQSRIAGHCRQPVKDRRVVALPARVLCRDCVGSHDHENRSEMIVKCVFDGVRPAKKHPQDDGKQKGQGCQYVVSQSHD